jgi:hypothetical protein
LLVVLDRVDWTRAGFIGIEACCDPRFPLPKEIPALVEPFLEPTEAIQVLLREGSTALARAKLMLLMR